MADLLTLPPPPEAVARVAAIPRTEIAPTILIKQDGLDGGGPEDAGAVLMLQATFDDAERAKGFWDAAVPLMELLADAPGFIKRYSFPDGPAVTLIAFWRTLADAQAFAATPEHRAAVKGLYQQRWQYSHFSALWELATSHGKVVFD